MLSEPEIPILFEYKEDADVLPSVQVLKADREYYIRMIISHSGVRWDGESELSLEDQVKLLKAAVELGCPNHPDLGYYLRHAAYRYAEKQRQFREGHHEYHSLCDVIHRQRAELARLNEQVRNSASTTNPKAQKNDI